MRSVLHQPLSGVVRRKPDPSHWLRPRWVRREGAFSILGAGQALR